MGRVVVGNENVLDSVRPEHDVNGMEYGVKNVLVLAGIELIFFIRARMGLCFGFVLKTLLITQGCFRYC